MAEGRVTVNGQQVRRSSSRAAAGDVVEVMIPAEDRRAPVLPQQIPLACLFEDAHLLVVNKPAGMVSHPTFKHPRGTLMNALLGRACTWPAGERPSLVGRLDKLTSGAVLVAKTSRAHALLQRAWRNPRTEKQYLAFVTGAIPPLQGEINLCLRRDPADRRRVVASAADGRPSTTRFERLATTPSGDRHVSLLGCRLVTGRMHQIRVHLAAIGFPLVGDSTYAGESVIDQIDGHAVPDSRSAAQAAPDSRSAAASQAADAVSAFPRQALHAWRIVLDSPFTGERLDVEAPLPEDLIELLRRSGLVVHADAAPGSLAERFRRAGGRELESLASRGALDRVLGSEL